MIKRRYKFYIRETNTHHAVKRRPDSIHRCCYVARIRETERTKL